MSKIAIDTHILLYNIDQVDPAKQDKNRHEEQCLLPIDRPASGGGFLP